MPKDNQYVVKAPYNFVPFAEHPVFRYESMDQLPSHNAIDGALLTGEIQVHVQAQTPIFVGKASEGPEREHFFRDLAGRFAIPGSTLRGLIRENMQILGFGLIQPGVDLDDYQIYFRDMASKADGVKVEIKKAYTTILGVRPMGKGKSISIPHNVGAGYLCMEKGKYLIYPVSEALRVSRDEPSVAQFRLSYGGHHNEPPHIAEVKYTMNGGKVDKLYPPDTPREDLPDGKKGVLLFTGKPVGKKPNHIYIFPELDKSVPALPPLTEKDILSYELDLKARKNSLKGGQKVKNVSFWELPKEGEHKPVFYVKYNEHIYFGMSRYPRVGYPYALSQGLPEEHLAAWERGTVPLDYPRAILGFADKDGSAYRSRVSFGDLVAVGNPTPLGPIQLDLLEPKPSYFPGYTVDGKPYIKDNFRLRGYKQYWLKEPSSPAASDKDNNFSSKMRPLPKNTEFTGTIRYKNLHPDELGLLLLALALDGEAYQSIGKGKPYGYGRTRLTVTALQEYNIPLLYEGFAYTPKPTEGDALKTTLSQYAESYVQRLKEHHGVDLRATSIWSDFMTMRQRICGGNAPVSYMELKEYTSICTPLPTVANAFTAAPPAARPSGHGVASQQSVQKRKPDEIKPGMIVTGRVKSLQSYGAFVDLGTGRDGMVHVSQVTNGFVKNIGDYLAVGDIIQVKILSIEGNRISLSIKQAT